MTIVSVKTIRSGKKELIMIMVDINSYVYHANQNVRVIEFVYMLPRETHYFWRCTWFSAWYKSGMGWNYQAWCKASLCLCRSHRPQTNCHYPKGLRRSVWCYVFQAYTGWFKFSLSILYGWFTTLIEICIQNMKTWKLPILQPIFQSKNLKIGLKVMKYLLIKILSSFRKYSLIVQIGSQSIKTWSIKNTPNFEAGNIFQVIDSEIRAIFNWSKSDT